LERGKGLLGEGREGGSKRSKRRRKSLGGEGGELRRREKTPGKGGNVSEEKEGGRAGKKEKVQTNEDSCRGARRKGGPMGRKGKLRGGGGVSWQGLRGRRRISRRGEGWLQGRDLPEWGEAPKGRRI